MVLEVMYVEERRETAEKERSQRAGECVGAVRGEGAGVVQGASGAGVCGVGGDVCGGEEEDAWEQCRGAGEGSGGGGGGGVEWGRGPVQQGCVALKVTYVEKRREAAEREQSQRAGEGYGGGAGGGVGMGQGAGEGGGGKEGGGNGA